MLRHRLNSIYYDKCELDRLFEKFPQIPVVANLRCGSWYCSADKNHTCYFKSTDGHDKQWDFNIRRLNSHFLEFIYKHNTVFVVDSTGNPSKVYPDALSKTLPIWATVMNRLFCAFGADGAKGVILPHVISERESSELQETVERKINDWVELAKSVLPEHLLELSKQKHLKRIDPIFVSSRDSFDASILIDDSTIKIICVSAGSSNTTHTDDTYILGAGDDEEMWSHGLTAEMFWNQPGEFLRHTTDAELEAYIHEMLRSTNDASSIQNEVMNDPIYGQILVSTTTSISEILIAFDDTRTITLNYTMKIKNVVYDLLCNLSSLYTTSYNIIHISGGNSYINIAICCAIAIFNYKYNTHGSDQHVVITKAFIRNIICRICAAADDFKLFPRRYCRELNTFFISRDT
jgi:tRNA A64-2'-O-ribosylphosphate transferase